jgi:organic radical activating enzyme
MASNLAMIHEVFNSISGEVSPEIQGCFCTFVRFYGCNLSTGKDACRYCDTDQSKIEADEYEINNLVDHVDSFYKRTGKLCITGGEPLLQLKAVEELVKSFKNVWIETNGTCDFSDFVSKCGIVADYKLQVFKNKIPIYFYKLAETDWVKFVISTKDQFYQAREVQKTLLIGGKAPKFAYSPVFDVVEPGNLAHWLQEKPLPNTFLNVQIHKLINMK